VESAFPLEVREALAKKGHDAAVMPHIGGGMNAIQFGASGPDGQAENFTGAACWREPESGSGPRNPADNRRKEIGDG
jgi:gamma-glutamyltranspeptidase/glutathione hydrolase